MAALFFFAATGLRLGFLARAFALALADFLLGVGNIGFETAAAADFCSAGAASSSLALFAIARLPDALNVL